MTDNGLAALAEALVRADYLSPNGYPATDSFAAAILGPRGVFLPDGLPEVSIKGLLEDFDGAPYLEDFQRAVAVREADYLGQIATLRAALEDMVRQFAYWSNSAGGIYTGGLSALEEAFDVLGWDDPYPLPDRRCDEPGCMEDGTMGWPTRPGGTGLNGGYRTTCWDHSDIGKARAILAIINPEETP